MSLVIEITVIPSSGRLKCIQGPEDTFKCYLKSPPEKGKANKELTKFLSKQLNIPQYRIKIISGATFRRKKIKIYWEITLQEVKDILCPNTDGEE